jgi:hypothetical protein
MSPTKWNTVKIVNLARLNFCCSGFAPLLSLFLHSVATQKKQTRVLFHILCRLQSGESLSLRFVVQQLWTMVDPEFREYGRRYVPNCEIFLLI